MTTTHPEALLCRRCKQHRPRDDFYNDRRNTLSGKDCSACKPCRRVLWQERYWSDPEHYRQKAVAERVADPGRYMRWKRQKKYNLSDEQYQGMLNQQRNRCAACRRPLAPNLTDVDHNHASGKVRGLLCRQCNVALGLLKDSPKRITQLLHYIEGNL